MIDYRPSDGGGSCARCRDRLSLASLKQRGAWYCGSACAEGRVLATPRSSRVPEAWLYARPRRFFKCRKPKELRSMRPGS
ncbi:MAG: hypothetical protein E2O69_03340 [Deltaproteobacteria bacterium]|nr:MAG: hypothetical protein E2O69_03340 [Deltaproteobacteria bacterium]